MRRAFFAVVGAAMLLGGVLPAHALSLQGLGIRPFHPKPPDPNWFVYQLKPGESVEDAVLVVNGTVAELIVQLEAVDSELTDIGAFGVKGSDDAQVGIGKWTQLATSTFRLASGESRAVPFTLAIPREASVGEHSGAIMLQPVVPPQSSQTSGVFITTRVGARIYNTVPGKLIRRIRLVRFTVQEEKDGRYSFTVVARNEGNVTVNPRLTLHLDGWGLVRQPPPGDPEDGKYGPLALFGLQRFLPHVQQSNWQLMREAQVETYFRWRKPYLGRFTAAVTLEYEDDDGPQVIRSQVLRFTVLPWPETAYALGALGLLAALLVGWLLWRRVRFSGRGWRSYKVKAGDTLVSLAGVCGVSWKHLAKVNRLKKPYAIAAGDELKVPPGAKLTAGEGKPESERVAAERKGSSRRRRSRLPRGLLLALIIGVGTLAVALAALLLMRSAFLGKTPAVSTLPAAPAPSAVLPQAAVAPTSTDSVPLAPTSTPPTTGPAKDTLKLQVLNGSGVLGLAGQVAEVFRQAGYRQVSAGNADAYSYQGVTIRYGPGFKGAAEDLATRLRDRYEKFTLEERATTTAADITVILGTSAAPAPSSE